MDITLYDNSHQVDEVVITGYQNIRNRVYTGAATSVKMNDIKLEGIADVSRMLEGRVPGLSIQNISGTFGSAPRINIRGGASIIGNVQPLWVIDGAVYEDLVHLSIDQLASGDAVTLISTERCFGHIGIRRTGIEWCNRNNNKVGQKKLSPAYKLLYGEYCTSETPLCRFRFTEFSRNDVALSRNERQGIFRHQQLSLRKTKRNILPAIQRNKHHQSRHGHLLSS